MSVELLSAFVATTFSGAVLFTTLPLIPLETSELETNHFSLNLGVYKCDNNKIINFSRVNIKEIQKIGDNVIGKFLSDWFKTTSLDSIFQYRVNGFDFTMIRPVKTDNWTSFMLYTKVDENIFDSRRIYIKSKNEFFYVEKKYTPSNTKRYII